MFLCSPKFSGRRQSLFKKSLEQYGQIQQTTFFQLERRQSFCFLYYRPLSVTYTTEQQLKEAGKVRAKKEDRLTLISDPCENPDKYVECQNGIDYHVTESIYIYVLDSVRTNFLVRFSTSLVRFGQNECLPNRTELWFFSVSFWWFSSV